MLTSVLNHKTLILFLTVITAITLYHQRYLLSVIRTVKTDTILTGAKNILQFLPLQKGSVFARAMSSDSEKLMSTDFEVFGRVQGVFFRKYTEKQAKSLGLRGWCMNTNNGTVQGVMEGVPSKVSEMKGWLKNTGSPQSKIDKAVFTNERSIPKYTFETFSVKR